MRALSKHTEDKRHALYLDLTTVMTAQLVEYGMQQAGAEAVANALADHIADYWGGQTITFPKEYQRHLSQRDVEIYQRYTQEAHDDLARELGITERGLYKLVARVRKRLRAQAANAPQLFELG